MTGPMYFLCDRKAERFVYVLSGRRPYSGFRRVPEIPVVRGRQNISPVSRRAVGSRWVWQYGHSFLPLWSGRYLSAKALAVTAMMGTALASGRFSCRIFRQAVQPSISGICMSIRTASTVQGSCSWKRSTASRPFQAGRISAPIMERNSVAISYSAHYLQPAGSFCLPVCKKQEVPEKDLLRRLPGQSAEEGKW